MADTPKQPNQTPEELPALWPGVSMLDQGPQGLRALEQSVAAIQERLSALEQSVASIQEGRPAPKQGVTAIQEGLDALRGEVDGMRSEISRNDKNAIARIINNSAMDGRAPLEPFYGVSGQLIPDFPENPREAMNLQGDRVDSLLLALGLEVTGCLTVRRNRFGDYIGLRFCR
ncbi:hypothetical protein HOY80DRAFT_1133956 [Tuber brumale]|nr:hypothetical protein HOY80DRAFT_1133956 [Tuber brumale]